MNKIDQLLLMLMKYTDNQVPHGSLTDIAEFLEVSRERVRQRANHLKLVMPRQLTTRACLFCNKLTNNKKYCNRTCSGIHTQKTRFRNDFYKYNFAKLSSEFTIKDVQIQCGYKTYQTAQIKVKNLRNMGLIKEIGQTRHPIRGNKTNLYSFVT